MPLAPYRARVYDSSGRTARMSDLMRAEAAARSNADLQAANASAQMWQGLGQTVANVAGDYAQAEREKPQRDLREAQAADIKQGLDTKRQITEVLKLTRNPETGELDLRQAAKEISLIDPVQAQEFFTAASAQEKQTLLENKARLDQLGQLAGATLLNLERMPPPQRAAAIRGVAQEAVSRGLVDAKDIPEQPTESWLRQAFTSVLSTSDLADRLAAQEKPQGEIMETVGPGGQPIKRRVGEDELETGVPVYQKPTEEPKAGTIGGFMAMLEQNKGAPLTRQEVLQARQQWETAGRAPREATPDNEPLERVMGDDGRPVFMRRSQAEGRTPASTREQGRQVTSGDAGRIAELDTSLDDLKVLRQTLTETAGATGTLARIGASLDPAITDLTGWGEDAKTRQGVIDRVKQVIGKALEGGVLRESDERKYEKILPTIKDPQPVAESKLVGLEKALVLRRERLLEALGDAGYDTSRFMTGSAETSQTSSIAVQAPDGITYTFSDQAAADAFKKAAGIK